MTAALIFRRQLVRRRTLNLHQALSASKLPLEKFHRLLDLAFWGKFLKSHTIPLFIFFFKSNRVLLNPVFKPPVFGACGAPNLGIAAGGGGPQLAVPPGPRLAIAKPH